VRGRQHHRSTRRAQRGPSEPPKIAGHRDAYLLQGSTDERVRFLPDSWDSIDAVHPFAGENAALVEPRHARRARRLRQHPRALLDRAAVTASQRQITRHATHPGLHSCRPVCAAAPWPPRTTPRPSCSAAGPALRCRSHRLRTGTPPHRPCRPAPTTARSQSPQPAWTSGPTSSPASTRWPDPARRRSASPHLRRERTARRAAGDRDLDANRGRRDRPAYWSPPPAAGDLER
jgi:hypothetical protein